MDLKEEVGLLKETESFNCNCQWVVCHLVREGSEMVIRREKHLERYKIVVGCSFQDQIMRTNLRMV